MKFYLLSLCSILTAATCGASQYLFVSHKQSPDITSYKIDPDSGKLSHHHTCTLEGSGGFLRFSPNGTHAYVNSSTGPKKEQTQQITTLSYANGKLNPIAMHPCNDSVSGMQVHPSGNTLACAHYQAGKTTTWKLNDQGVFTGEIISDINTAERAHYVTLSPNHQYLYVPHTRPNAIFQFSWSQESGQLTPLSPPQVQGPDKEHMWHEPRHLAFHPSHALAYSSNERGGGISSWLYNAENGQLNLRNTVSSLPEGFTGQSAASDIKLTPNGKFAYIANRSKKPVTSTIASFQLASADGAISPIGHTPIEAGTRALHIDSTGTFLYAAGTATNKLLAFRIHPDTGQLTLIETYKTEKAPFWLQSQHHQE